MLIILAFLFCIFVENKKMDFEKFYKSLDTMDKFYFL